MQRKSCQATGKDRKSLIHIVSVFEVVLISRLFQDGFDLESVDQGVRLRCDFQIDFSTVSFSLTFPSVATNAAASNDNDARRKTCNGQDCQLCQDRCGQLLS